MPARMRACPYHRSLVKPLPAVDSSERNGRKRGLGILRKFELAQDAEMVGDRIEVAIAIEDWRAFDGPEVRCGEDEINPQSWIKALTCIWIA